MKNYDRRYEGFEQRELELAEEARYDKSLANIDDRIDTQYRDYMYMAHQSAIADLSRAIKTHGVLSSEQEISDRDMRYRDQCLNSTRSEAAMNKARAAIADELPYDINRPKLPSDLYTISKDSLVNDARSVCLSKLANVVIKQYGIVEVTKIEHTCNKIAETINALYKATGDSCMQNWFIRYSNMILKSATDKITRAYGQYCKKILSISAYTWINTLKRDASGNFIIQAKDVVVMHDPQRYVDLSVIHNSLLSTLRIMNKHIRKGEAVTPNIPAWRRHFVLYCSMPPDLNNMTFITEDRYFANCTKKGVTRMRIGSISKESMRIHWSYLMRVYGRIKSITDHGCDFGYKSLPDVIQYAVEKYAYFPGKEFYLDITWKPGFNPGIFSGKVDTLKDRVNSIIRMCKTIKDNADTISSIRYIEDEFNDADTLIEEAQDLISKYLIIHPKHVPVYDQFSIWSKFVLPDDLINSILHLHTKQIDDELMTIDKMYNKLRIVTVGQNRLIQSCMDSRYSAYEIFEVSRRHLEYVKHLYDDGGATVQTTIDTLRAEYSGCGYNGFSIGVDPIDLPYYLDYIWQNRNQVKSFKFDDITYLGHERAYVNAYRHMNYIVCNVDKRKPEYKLEVEFKRTISSIFPPDFKKRGE